MLTTEDIDALIEDFPVEVEATFCPVLENEDRTVEPWRHWLFGVKLSRGIEAPMVRWALPATATADDVRELLGDIEEALREAGMVP